MNKLLVRILILLYISFTFTLKLLAQELPVLWEDHFDDEDSLARKNVGWIYYSGQDVKGQIIEQRNGELFMESGSYLSILGVAAVVTNGIPEIKLDENGIPTPETEALLLRDNYSAPNQILNFKFKFIRLTNANLIIGTRLTTDSLKIDLDVTAVAGYALLINPQEKSMKLGRYDSGLQVLVPESWTYFDSTQYEFEIEVYYRIKWYLHEGELKLKIWEGEPEDESETWLLDANDPTPRVKGTFTLFGLLGSAPEPGQGDRMTIDDVVLTRTTPTAVNLRNQGRPVNRLCLTHNYPNPFNSSTTIRFDLPASGPIKLAIFNLDGQLVRILTDGTLQAGTHRIGWNGLDEQGKSVASGIYLYQLTNGLLTVTRRMLLLK